MKYLFIDLETTGVEPKYCEIIEVMARTADKSIYYHDLFKPNRHADQLGQGNMIPFEVSGITNIDDHDVQDKSIFVQSSMHHTLMQLAQSDEYIAVCHNTDFDLAVLAAHGIHFKKSICTLVLARYFLPDLPNHKQGTLRSYYGITASGSAHRADYDVEVLIDIFTGIIEDWKLRGGNVEPGDMLGIMVKAREEVRLRKLSIWPFGKKFKGQKVDVNNDQQRNYMRWWVSQPEDPKYPRDPEFFEHINKLLEDYGR